jgi:hypothetical protein
MARALLCGWRAVPCARRIQQKPSYRLEQHITYQRNMLTTNHRPAFSAGTVGTLAWMATAITSIATVTIK